MDQRLRYIATNENLYAIKRGLDLRNADVILTVTGGGDQAFSFLEHVDRVWAVDNNPRQLDYLRKQVDLIRAGDHQSFRNPQVLLRDEVGLGFDIENLDGFNESGLRQRAKYFTARRLHSIAKKLGDLVIAGGSVLGALENAPINKMYLSNIVGYSDSDFGEGSLLFAGINQLPVGGLVYLSNPAAKTFLSFAKDHGLARDERLTAVSRLLEPHWRPEVFRRIR